MPGRPRPRGEDRAVHDVLHVNEIADLLAVLENARRLPAADLLRELQDHAGGRALVRLARAVDVEVAQADHDLRRIFARESPREIVELHLGERVDVGRLRLLVDLVHAGGDAVGRGG